VQEYHRVIETARVPVLVRGGGKASEEEILSRTHALMQQGARGIVYGRNIIQHPDPAGITRALMAVVHDGADSAQAMKVLKGSNVNGKTTDQLWCNRLRPDGTRIRQRGGALVPPARPRF
jgi:thiazole synthase ThiGH ThiG subunit